MSIEARQIQETLYSYAAMLNFTPSPQGLRAKFGACSVQNAQLLHRRCLCGRMGCALWGWSTPVITYYLIQSTLSCGYI